MKDNNLLYADVAVVFREVPDEIALAVNIAGCPIRCRGCHSPWLWEDRGKVLTEESLLALVDANPGVTCVALMGGDGDPSAVARLLASVKMERPALKTCWYSGRGLEEARRYVGPNALDYLKVGPYIEALGALDNPLTNQRMYRVVTRPAGEGYVVEYQDITERFNKRG